ncbi:MAG: hypothetical protein SGPRY_002707 [Prymnesium sp.]
MSSVVRDLVEEEEEDAAAAREPEEAGEEDESEDEDFVPEPISEGEESEGEENAFEDDIPEVDAPPDAKRKPAGSRSKQRPPAKKPKRAKPAGKPARKSKGGIFLESDEDPSFDDPPQSEAPAPPGPSTSSSTPTAVASKPSVDDLWASMNAPQSSKADGPTSKVDQSSKSDGPTSKVDQLWETMKASSEKPPQPKTSGLDIKALLQKTSRGGSASGSNARIVEIKQARLTLVRLAADRMDFCGEEVIVTKKVAAGSKEEEEYKQSGLMSKQSAKDIVASSVAQGVAQPFGVVKSIVPLAFLLIAHVQSAKDMKQASVLGSSAASGLRFSEELAFKEALPCPKLPGQAVKPTGLQGLLASLDGKKKMSTMEKSKYDWNTFKNTQDEQTLVGRVRFYRMADVTHPAFDHLDNRRDCRVIRLAQSELKKASQDGYLEKRLFDPWQVAFLQRTDQRQADVARSNRRKGMGLKD